MLEFERHSAGGVDRIQVPVQTLIVAGWTGRDEAALRHHIEELASIGVPRPSSVPVFYRIASLNLVQAGRIEVLGPHTSGEVEPVIVALDDGLWLGLGSDHTDRKAETIGIAVSKQLCAKPLAKVLWRFDEVVDHWDELIIQAFATIDGRRVLYQEGRLSAMRQPSDLIARIEPKAGLARGTVMFCGTIGAMGGIRPAARFEMAIEDPILGRKIESAYDIDALPVVS